MAPSLGSHASSTAWNLGPLAVLLVAPCRMLARPGLLLPGPGPTLDTGPSPEPLLREASSHCSSSVSRPRWTSGVLPGSKVRAHQDPSSPARQKVGTEDVGWGH